MSSYLSSEEITKYEEPINQHYVENIEYPANIKSVMTSKDDYISVAF